MINEHSDNTPIYVFYLLQVKEYIDKNPITFFTANPAKDNRKFQITVKGTLSNDINKLIALVIAGQRNKIDF